MWYKKERRKIEFNWKPFVETLYVFSYKVQNDRALYTSCSARTALSYGSLCGERCHGTLHLTLVTCYVSCRFRLYGMTSLQPPSLLFFPFGVSCTVPPFTKRILLLSLAMHKLDHSYSLLFHVEKLFVHAPFAYIFMCDFFDQLRWTNLYKTPSFYT